MIILSLKATENAVEFYERFGFVRVGAVARYEEISTEVNEGDSTEEEEEESESSGSEYQNSDEEDASEGEDTDEDEEDSTSDEEDDSGSSDGEEEGDENSESDDDDGDAQGRGKGRKRKRRNESKKKRSKKLKVENDPEDGLTERERVRYGGANWSYLRRRKILGDRKKQVKAKIHPATATTRAQKMRLEWESLQRSTVLSSNFFLVHS